jgi:hypothetical protein
MWRNSVLLASQHSAQAGRVGAGRLSCGGCSVMERPASTDVGPAHGALGRRRRVEAN